MARELAAGAITLLTTPEFTGQVRGELGTGNTLVVQQLAVPFEDAARARDTARGTIGFLAQVTGYQASLLRMGFSERDVDGPSDRLVDAVTVWGDETAIARRVAAHREAGADHVSLSVLSGEGGPTLLDAGRRIADQLGLAAVR